MARIYGIVAEFNPFHSGHALAAAEARRRGGTAVVAVMSGNFVQRGSPAIVDKRVRARAALHCGVDLVLELPLPYAAAPAQRFARGAVEILAAAGVVDGLLFGSESGDAAALSTLADAVDAPETQPRIRERLAAGMTYAKAREQAVAEIAGVVAAGLATPNNALAVEYLRAARQVGWRPEIATIRRQGAAHDSAEAAGGYASASLLRRHAERLDTLRAYLPPEALPPLAEAAAAGRYPADPARLEIAMLAHLRRLAPADLACLPDLSEGLENRLYAAIRGSTTLAELEQALKTKRYTMARVRRLILAAFLGVTREDCQTPPPYIRVLGFNERGKAVLAQIKRSCPLPVHHSLARLRDMGGACRRFVQLEETSTDLYSLALPHPPACGYEYSASAVFLK